MLFQSKFSRKGWFTGLVVSLVASVLVACGGGGGSTSSSTQPIYTMVFDAGSSGTRVNFYKVVSGNGGYPQITLLDSQSFDDNGINDFLSGVGTINRAAWTASSSTGLPSNYNPSSCTMTTGVANGDQATVGPCVIQPLLDSMAGAMAAVGVTASQVKVELFATAGMRTMSLFNGGSYNDTEIANFYNTMKSYTQTTKGFTVGEFRTSNGNSEEGVWTWINLNDQYYNAFGGNTTYYTGTPTTRGDFEVGGSSMQVAFPTTSITPSAANNVYSVTINGHSYNVFSKTYLGLGGDDARKFMRSYNYNNTAIPSSTYTGLDCFGSNAGPSNTQEDSGVALFNTSAFNIASVITNFFPSITANPSATNATGVTWATVLSNTLAPLVMSGPGVYNLSTCTTKYNNVTNAVIELPRNNYGTDNQSSAASYSSLITKVASSSAPFVGLDGFYYTSQSLGLVPSGQLKSNFDRSQFTTAIASTCPNSGAGPSGTNLNAVRVCPDAAYMNNFLWQFSNSGGLFSSNTGATFEGVVPSNLYPGGVKTAVLTWTRGYLLQKYAN